MPKIIPLYASVNRGFSDEPVVELDYGYKDKKIKIKISYFFPGFTISNNKRKILKNNKIRWRLFKEVKMSGTGFLSVDEEPLLPSFGLFVQIPPYYRVDKFEPRKYNRRDFQKKLLIPWAEESALDNKGIKFNEEKYGSKKFSPEKVAEHSGPYYMDGYKALLVHVRPLQYNPNEEVLRGYGKIKVSITLSRSEMEEKERFKEFALTDPNSNLEGFGNLLLNPERRWSEETSTIRQPSAGIPNNKPEEAEFLIIYDDTLKKPAEKLEEWKNKRGLVTKAVSAAEEIWKEIDEEIKKDKEEFKKAKIEKLKNYIRDIRLIPFSRLRYVLLFGDVGKIPLSQEPSDDDVDVSRNNTDHYFYTHKDSSDSECLLPWVSGGRIPVEKMEDGMSVVDQIIRYEKEPPCDREYYKRMTVAAEFDDKRSGLIKQDIPDGRAEQNFLKTMEDIRKHMICQGFEVNRVYFSQSQNPLQYRDGTPLPQEVKDDIILDENIATKLLIDYINEGQLIVGHRGHGCQDGWEHPRFKVVDLNSISSGTSIFFSVNCLTGRFHYDEQDIFAEQILLNGGAPSLIAANDLSYRWRNDSMVKALFDAIWPGIIPTFPKTNTSYPVKYHRLGDILNYAKAYVLVKHSANSHTKEQLEFYHIVGDPTLEIWGDEPSTLSLSASIMRDILNIKMSTCPKDSVLTIWYGDKLKRKEPSSTLVSIPLMDLDNNPPYSVCFSAPGYRFTEVTA